MRSAARGDHAVTADVAGVAVAADVAEVPVGGPADPVRVRIRCVQAEPRAHEGAQAEHKGETAQSINRYIARAERLELIADRPGLGRGGGTMTDKCRRILDRREDDS